MITEEVTYSNDIKIVKEVSTYEDDPYYRESHYNKDGFHFYYRYLSNYHNEFWFKSPYWISTINYDPNREVTLISKCDNRESIFDKTKCAFKVNNMYFIGADVVAMVEDIK